MPIIKVDKPSKMSRIMTLPQTVMVGRLVMKTLKLSCMASLTEISISMIAGMETTEMLNAAIINKPPLKAYSASCCVVASAKKLSQTVSSMAGATLPMVTERINAERANQIRLKPSNTPAKRYKVFWTLRNRLSEWSKSRCSCFS